MKLRSLRGEHLFAITATCMLSLTMLWQKPTEAFTPGAAEIHYAPGADLQAIDIDLLNRAEHNIDFAAYVLTSWPIITALTKAADRGVFIRIVLDYSELQKDQSRAFRLLLERPNVQVRVKRGDELLHLKSYCIDMRWVRTGSANFSVSGLTRQSNDIVILDNAAISATFANQFKWLFSNGETLAAAAARGKPQGWIP